MDAVLQFFPGLNRGSLNTPPPELPDPSGPSDLALVEEAAPEEDPGTSRKMEEPEKDEPGPSREAVEEASQDKGGRNGGMIYLILARRSRSLTTLFLWINGRETCCMSFKESARTPSSFINGQGLSRWARKMLFAAIPSICASSSKKIAIYNEEMIVAHCFVGFIIFSRKSLGKTFKVTLDGRIQVIQEESQQFPNPNEVVPPESNEQQ
ncbi:hypothetical protein AgCh_030970 [Apium graveolens]